MAGKMWCDVNNFASHILSHLNDDKSHTVYGIYCHAHSACQVLYSYAIYCHMHSTLTLHGYMYMDKIAFVTSVNMDDPYGITNTMSRW